MVRPACKCFFIPEQSASTYSVLRSRRSQDGYPHVQSHDNQHGFNEPFPRLGYLNADQLSGHLHSTRKHRRLRFPCSQVLSSLRRHRSGHRLAQYRPGNTREFVCQGHDDDIALHAPGQHCPEPLADGYIALIERMHRRSSAVNKQGSQIGIAALGYAHQPRLTAGRELSAQVPAMLRGLGRAGSCWHLR